MRFRPFIYIFSILLLLSIIVFFLDLTSYHIIIILILYGIIRLAIGASHIQHNFFITSIHNGAVNKQEIALTFDDGPDAERTLAVANTIEKHRGKATFFCIGRNIEKHPDIIKQLYIKGHQIANHSFSHSHNIDFKSKAGWLAEIHTTDALIKKYLNLTNTYFRPPYGVTTPHLAAALKTTKHKCIGWRVRSYDTTIKNTSHIIERILRIVKAGDIILLHDTHDRIIPLLEQLLPLLRQKGYTFVTVEQLINHAHIPET